MSEQTKSHVSFNSENTKNKESNLDTTDKSKKSEETDVQSEDPSKILSKKYNDDESDLNLSHIKNIDLYDKLNFQRIKRSSIKANTTVMKMPRKFNIQKFTDEITKYVEEIDVKPKEQETTNTGTRKRTIKFSTQKVVYQYNKISEGINTEFNKEFINETTEEEELKSERGKEKESDKGNIFVFNEHDHDHDDEEQEESQKNDDGKEENNKDKQHIDLNVIEM